MQHAEQTTPNVSPSLAGRWKLDADRTEIEFRTRSMWGLLPVRGSFRAFSGYVEVSSAGEVEGRVEVDATSIATGMKVRDGHLRGAGFLEVEQDPRITFDPTTMANRFVVRAEFRRLDGSDVA